jgi:hypothetical protein
MILVFILIGTIAGLLGGWLTGAVLYKNMFSVLLRMITFPVTVGSAAAVGGYLYFGNNGIFGFLVAVPAALIVFLCIKCIEPKFKANIAATPDLDDTAASSAGNNTEERHSLEGEGQVTYAGAGIMAGGVLGYLGYTHFGVVGGLIASTIVAVVSALLVYGGIVVTCIMLVEICLFVLPLIGSFFVGLWNYLVDFFYWIGSVFSAFMDWLTHIGDRIGNVVSKEDKRINRE